MPIGPDTDRHGAGRRARDAGAAWKALLTFQPPPGTPEAHDDLGALGAAPVLADKLTSDGGK